MENAAQSETIKKETADKKENKETSFKNLVDNFINDIENNVKKKRSKQHGIIKRNPKLNYNRGVAR